MPIFLQPVEIAIRCFLSEVLLWVAFQRLPIALYTVNGKEVRETSEIGDYEVDVGDNVLSDDETKRAKIPNDPAWVARDENKTTLSVSSYDDWLARNDNDDVSRRLLEAKREEAGAYEKACEDWNRQYQIAIEYPTSKIFVALTDGSLRARGRLLPAIDLDEARSILEAEEREILDIAPTDIPPSFWTLRGISFKESTAKSNTDHYCHISFNTEEVLSVFPGEREEVTGVQRVGDSFVLSDKRRGAPPSVRRGRPPYPWEAFYVEVAGLLHRSELPEKKEAAIEQLQNWFQREHGVAASRSVIGDKLKPYYDKFVRVRGRKIR